MRNCVETIHVLFWATLDAAAEPGGVLGWFDDVRIRSLRLSLVLYVVLPLLAVLTTAGYLAQRSMEGWVEARMQDEVELVARSIQEPLSRSLRRARPGAVSELLEAAFSLSQVYTVQVFGADGQQVALVGDPQPPEDPDVGDMLEQGEDGGTYARMGGREVYSYFASLNAPDGRPIGLLHLSRRRSDFDREFDRLRLQSAGLLLGGGLLMIGVVLFGHHRSVGRHLNRLADDAARIEGGDRGHRASTEPPAEIARLARGFNAMLDSLESARQEIARRRDAQSSLEQRLRRTEKLAAIGQLAGGVAHELGSPLSVIGGHAQRILHRDDVDEDVRERLEKIRRQERRMEEIVNRLLEFGRRKGARPRRPVQVGWLIRDATASVEQTLDMAETELEVDGPGDEVEVVAESARVSRALANLLQNAVQASPGGRVWLRWTADETEVRFVVEDDGPGIDPEIRDHLFEPFATTRPPGRGTGLGLAVVHATAEDHDGRVEVGESALGGASFTLVISRELEA